MSFTYNWFPDWALDDDDDDDDDDVVVVVVAAAADDDDGVKMSPEQERYCDHLRKMIKLNQFIL